MQQHEVNSDRRPVWKHLGLSSLLCLLPFAVLLCAQTTQGARDREGSRGILVENLLSKLYPGSTVQWEPTFALIGPGGVKQRLALPGFTQILVQGGWLGVAGLESLDAKTNALTALAGFQPPAGNIPAEIVVFRSDSNLNVLDTRRSIIDSNAPLGEILYVGVRDTRNGNAWPLVNLTYRTNFATDQWFGRVTWQAEFDADSSTVTGRSPVAIYKRVRSAPKADEELISVKRLDAATIEVQGLSSQRSITLPCANPCQIDAKALLNQW